MKFYKFNLKAKMSSQSNDLDCRGSVMKYRRVFGEKLKESSPSTLIFISNITSALESDECTVEGAAVTADICVVPWDIEEVVSDCGSLSNINILDSVVCIGNYAFTLCKSLTSVTIPKHTEIADYAFDDRVKITRV